MPELSTLSLLSVSVFPEKKGRMTRGRKFNDVDLLSCEIQFTFDEIRRNARSSMIRLSLQFVGRSEVNEICKLLIYILGFI